MKHNRDLINYISSFLGDYKITSDSNISFHCPFCNHHKNKLEINVGKNDEKQGWWHCWVCNEGGHKITSLFYKLNYDKSIINEIKRLTNDKISDKYYNSKIHNLFNKQTDKIITLNSDFIPLYTNNKYSNKLEFNLALDYLYSRGLTFKEIERFKIHYTEKAIIDNKIIFNRIIIPSYDDNFNLNFYITRDYSDSQYIAYWKPKLQQNIIFFEHLINWKFPIFLVEGVFDAMTLKYNAIPLLGKTINKILLTKLQLTDADKYIILDNDAYKDSIKLTNVLLQHGVTNVYLVLLQDKDVNQMGYKKAMNYIVNNNIKMDIKKLLKLQL